jgi:ethanolamine utilization protein EutM
MWKSNVKALQQIDLLLTGGSLSWRTMPRNALGLIETKGLIGAITATDAAAKAAAVVISSAELTDATFFTIRIEGELGAVQAAVEAATAAAQMLCELVAVTVIPNPDDALAPILPALRYVSKYHPDDTRPQLGPDDGDIDPDLSGAAPSGTPTAPSGGGAKGNLAGGPRWSDDQRRGYRSQGGARPELGRMSVAGLRRYARTLAGFPLQGREISRANKKQLLETIRAFLKEDSD